MIYFKYQEDDTSDLLTNQAKLLDYSEYSKNMQKLILHNDCRENLSLAPEFQKIEFFHRNSIMNYVLR